jgi:hypothetical protein
MRRSVFRSGKLQLTMDRSKECDTKPNCGGERDR